MLMLVSLCLIYALICLTKNCFSSAMVFIVDEGILTKSQTGMITGVFYIIYAALQLVGGMLADRWKPEALVGIGLVGAGIANAVIYFNQSYAIMMAAWSFNAVAQFAVWPSIFKIMSTMLSPEHRAKGLFIVMLANPAGVMVSYLTAAVVSRWQNNFLISSVGLLVSAVYWIILCAVSSRSLITETVDSDAPKSKRTGNGNSGEFNLVGALFRSGAMLLVVVAFIKTAFDLGVKSLMPSIIKESYSEVSPKLATILSIIVLVAGVVGLYTAKFWYPGRFRTEASATAAMFVMALIPCGVALFIGKISYWFIVAALALLVLLMSSVGLYATSYLPTRFEKWGKGGTIAGVTNFAASLGVVLANMVFTRIADAVGWIITVRIWFVILAVGAALALLAIPLWNRFLRKEGL